MGRRRKKEEKLDLLFSWFGKTLQGEDLRKEAMESVGLTYKLRETRDDAKPPITSRKAIRETQGSFEEE